MDDGLGIWYWYLIIFCCRLEYYIFICGYFVLKNVIIVFRIQYYIVNFFNRFGNIFFCCSEIFLGGVSFEYKMKRSDEIVLRYECFWFINGMS